MFLGWVREPLLFSVLSPLQVTEETVRQGEGRRWLMANGDLPLAK